MRQYEKRDKAYKHWEQNEGALNLPELRHLNPSLQDAFNAGWKARKLAEYETMYEIKERN
jgi:hypothetical protein